MVVNEAFPRRYFAGLDPLGKVVVDEGEPVRIIGVVADAAERTLIDAMVPVRYLASSQMLWGHSAQSLVLAAAPGVDATTLLEPARRAIVRVAPGVAVQQTSSAVWLRYPGLRFSSSSSATPRFEDHSLGKP